MMALSQYQIHISIPLNIHFYNSISHRWEKRFRTSEEGNLVRNDFEQVAKVVIYFSLRHLRGFSVHLSWHRSITFLEKKGEGIWMWGWEQMRFSYEDQQGRSHKIHFYHLALIIISIFYTAHMRVAKKRRQGK